MAPPPTQPPIIEMIPFVVIIVSMKPRAIVPMVYKTSLTAQTPAPAGGAGESDVVYRRTCLYAERIAVLDEISCEYHTWKGDIQSGIQRVYRSAKIMEKSV